MSTVTLIKAVVAVLSLPYVSYHAIEQPRSRSDPLGCGAALWTLGTIVVLAVLVAYYLGTQL